MTGSVSQAADMLGGRARRDVPIGPMTTYRVGGPAALFAEIADEADLAAVCAAVAASGVGVLVVGAGSNLLVSDAGYDGLAVHLSGAFASLSIDESLVEAGGALAFPVVARRCVAAHLVGMEWAVGIPGSVGGAVRMNAGGHGAETKDWLRSARVVNLASGDPNPRDVPTAQLSFSYRHSAILPTDLVVSAIFELQTGLPDGAGRLSEIVRWRRENQPGGQNAGSVFTNPVGDSAGRLIDSIGLKGFRIGTAAVSDKHANFIQADAGGSADDVRRVIDSVKQSVLERTGVELAVEVRFVG